MIRNLSILRLVPAAVLALSVVIVPTASAQIGKLTAEGPVTLLGSETGAAAENSFTGVLGYEVRCPGSTYTGHTMNGTPHAFLPSTATEVTVTPKYVNCNHALTMNGCDYVLRDATTTGGVVGTFGVVFDIVCPAGKNVTIANALCSGGVVNIPAQTGLTGLHLTHTTGMADDIDLTGTVNITSICSGVHATAVQHLDMTIKGQSPVTIGRPVTISD